MALSSLRSRLGRSVAPLESTVCVDKHDLRVECGFVGPAHFEFLPLPQQFLTAPDTVRLSAVISPDWVPGLLELAMPARCGHVHELPLLNAQLVVFKVSSDVKYDIMPSLGWLERPSGSTPHFFDSLFEPLSWADIDGKHYGTRQAKTAKKTPKRGRPRAKPQLRKSYELSGKQSRTRERLKYRSLPSFWDIIFPILQPPLEIDSSESIFLPYPLYPFQRPGVTFLFEHPSALLGDEMGTGKTVMASVAMRLLFRQAQVRQALVVCPVSVLRVWDQHLMEWSPELSVTVVHGQRQARQIDWVTPAHVYVTTYDTLRSDMESGNLPEEMWRKFDLVVADEIQYVKNSTSKRSRALRKLTPPRRWGLSGTPMENKPEDIISIFQFLKPGVFEGEQQLDAIKRKMAPYFLRRRKKDVLPDLPPKVRQEIWLDLDTNQRRAYRELENRIRSDFIGRQERGETISRVHIFSAIQRLKQICNFAAGKTSSPKTTALMDIVEEIAASGGKVIVFSQYVQEGVAKLEHLLRPFGVTKVVGGQSNGVRAAEIDRFRSDPEAHVMLMTVRSGSVGLTLTEASYVVHFDHWWNPASKWQAEDRAHRSGQQAASVNIYEFWMNDTIDQRIWDIIQRKQIQFESIVDSLSEDDVIGTSITDEELLDSIMGATAKSPRVPLQPKVGHQLSLGEIVNRLQQMSPSGFERFTGELFRYLGYPYTRVTGQSSDGGIDVIAWKNTADGPKRVIIQCKRYKGSVGVNIMRELAGSVASDPTVSKGILVTTGRLTSGARRLCERTEYLAAIEGLVLAQCVRDFGILDLSRW